MLCKVHCEWRIAKIFFTNKSLGTHVSFGSVPCRCVSSKKKRVVEDLFFLRLARRHGTDMYAQTLNKGVWWSRALMNNIFYVPFAQLLLAMNFFTLIHPLCQFDTNANLPSARCDKCQKVVCPAHRYIIREWYEQWYVWIYRNLIFQFQ